MLLPVTKIQRFSTHDGPGIRTTVFLKGCPLHCAWCHNPETQSEKQQLFFVKQLCIGCGGCVQICPQHAHIIDAEGAHHFDPDRCRTCLACSNICPTKALEPVCQYKTPQEVLEIVLKDAPFYGKNGGLTLSGGEPLLHAGKSLSLLQLAKRAGLHTAVETCGQFDSAVLPDLVQATDLFLWDVKDTNPIRHKEYTGVSGDTILKNLYIADSLGATTLLRCIIVKGVNLDDAHFSAIGTIFSKLQNCIGVELIPYHAYGGSKNAQLGYGENGRREWIPSEEDMAYAANQLQKAGCILYKK